MTVSLSLSRLRTRIYSLYSMVVNVMRLKHLGWIVVVALLCIRGAQAEVFSAQRYQLNIPATSMDDALNQLARATGFPVLFCYDLVETLDASALVGKYSVESALESLLKGSGLTGEMTRGGVIVVLSQDGSQVSSVCNKSVGRGEFMHKKVKSQKKQLLNAILLSFLWSGGSLAEEDVGGQEGSTWLLEEVVVTAQKREQKLVDVPISVTAVTGEEIASAGLNSVQELSFSVPSLSVIDQGAGLQRFAMRGVGNGAGANPLVGLYLDEVPMSFDSQITRLDMRLVDLQRVEVLRGPQGTIYGQGAMTGNIKFVTRAPEFGGLGAGGDMSISSTKSGGWSQTLTGVVNVPVVDDVFALRLAGNYQNLGGWIDQPAISKSDINDAEIKDLRIKGLWLVSDNLDISGMVVVHQGDADAANWARDDGTFTQAALTIDPRVRPSFNDYNIYNITATYDFGGITLLSSTGFVENESRISVPLFLPQSGGAEDLELLLHQDQEGDVFTQELRLSSDVEGALSWVTGLFYRDMERDLASNFIFSEPIPPSPPADTETSESWAVFGDVSYALSDRVEIGGGVRYYEDDREIIYPQVNEEQAGSYDAITSRAFLSYQLAETTRVYFNYAEGFRSGGFNVAGEPVYDPEDLRSYELGSKMRLLDGRLRAEVSLYYMEYEDMLLQTVVPPFLTENVGEAEVKGVDWSLDWDVNDQLLLGFSGDVNDSELTDVRVGSIQIPGDSLDAVPEYSYSLSATYSLNWNDTLPGYMRFDYSEQGEQIRTARNEPEPFGYSGVINMMSLRVGVEADAWKAEFFVTNILDDNDALDPFGNVEPESRPRPRTVGVKIGIPID